jgi:hypothetical protein
VKRDPYNGWRNVLQQNGINPAWLVQPHEYGQGCRSSISTSLPQAQSQDSGRAYNAAVLDEWAASNPGADSETIGFMAEIMRSPGFKHERTALKTLNKAYKQARPGVARKSHRQKSDEGLDAALAYAAEGLFDE